MRCMILIINFGDLDGDCTAKDSKVKHHDSSHLHQDSP